MSSPAMGTHPEKTLFRLRSCAAGQILGQGSHSLRGTLVCPWRRPWISLVDQPLDLPLDQSTIRGFACGIHPGPTLDPPWTHPGPTLDPLMGSPGRGAVRWETDGLRSECRRLLSTLQLGVAFIAFVQSGKISSSQGCSGGEEQGWVPGFTGRVQGYSDPVLLSQRPNPNPIYELFGAVHFASPF